MKVFRFIWNNRTADIRAISPFEAQALFQERFGFWPSDIEPTVVG